MGKTLLFKTWILNLFRKERNKRYPAGHPKLRDAIHVSSYVETRNTKEREAPND